MTIWCVMIGVNPGTISDVLVYVLHVIAHLVNVIWLCPKCSS